MDILKKLPAIAIGIWIWDNVFGQPNQPPLQLNADEAADHYRQLIEALRDRLAGGVLSHGIRVMRNPATVDDNQRFLVVQLSNENHLSITLAIDITNAYVVAYRAENRSYFFRNHFNSARSSVFTDTQQAELPFESGYDSMLSDMAAGAQNRAKKKGNQAGSSSSQIINRPSITRAEINLGVNELQTAISSLYNYQRADLARSLIVVIQMISEAARFTYIEQRVVHSFENYQTFRPDDCMMTLETNWESLSAEVQESNSQGVFRRRVQLQTVGGQIFFVMGVTKQLLEELGLALLKYNNPGHDEF